MQPFRLMKQLCFTNTNSPQPYLRQWVSIVVPCKDLKEGDTEYLQRPGYNPLVFTLTPV